MKVNTPATDRGTAIWKRVIQFEGPLSLRLPALFSSSAFPTVITP